MSLERVHNQIADMAAQIETLFREESEPKVTILVQNKRLEGSPEHSSDLVVTSSDIDSVIESLKYLKREGK